MMKTSIAAAAVLMTIMGATNVTAAAAAAVDPSTCRRVEVPRDPEDMELDRWSSPPRLIVGSLPPVAIPIVDGVLGEAVPLVVDARVRERFDPVGISLVRRDEKTLLYAINKGVGVEVFELAGNELKSIETLRSDLIRNPNGIAATTSGDVYVSNVSAHGGIRGRLSILFRTRSGNVVRYHDGKWSVAVTPVRFGNGMLLSPDESQLWVASFTDRRIDRYRRDTTTGALTHQTTIRLAAHPDNLKWDGYPRLIAAVHPSYSRTGLHITVPRLFNAPSQVAVLSDATAAAPEAVIIFEDASGKVISGASTAVASGGRLFLSQIRRRYVVDCVARE